MCFLTAFYRGLTYDLQLTTKPSRARTQVWIKPPKKAALFLLFTLQKIYLRHPEKQWCFASCHDSKFSTRTRIWKTTSYPVRLQTMTALSR